MHVFWLSDHDAHYSITEPSCLTCVLCGHHVYEEEMICYQKRIHFRFSFYVSDANVLKYKYIIYKITNLSVFYVHHSDLFELSDPSCNLLQE